MDPKIASCLWVFSTRSDRANLGISWCRYSPYSGGIPEAWGTSQSMPVFPYNPVRIYAVVNGILETYEIRSWYHNTGNCVSDHGVSAQEGF